MLGCHAAGHPRQQRKGESLEPSQTAARSKAGGDRKREREVYEAAARIFYEKGYQATTVQDVADALGILKGSLYHYIDGKEDLLYELLAETHREVDRILHEVAAMDALAPMERLEIYVSKQVRFSALNLHKVSVYYADLDRLSGERRERILARRTEHEAFVRELIVEAQGRGEARKDDPSLLANCIFAVVIWVYRWYNPDGPMDADTLAESCARFATAGIR